jgi:hypothetical protein
MKKVIGLLMVLVIVISSCGPKPMYKTSAGKKKLKHYNALQYNDRSAK